MDEVVVVQCAHAEVVSDCSVHEEPPFSAVDIKAVVVAEEPSHVPVDREATKQSRQPTTVEVGPVHVEPPLWAFRIK